MGRKGGRERKRGLRERWWSVRRSSLASVAVVRNLFSSTHRDDTTARGLIIVGSRASSPMLEWKRKRKRKRETNVCALSSREEQAKENLCFFSLSFFFPHKKIQRNTRLLFDDVLERPRRSPFSNLKPASRVLLGKTRWSSSTTDAPSPRSVCFL